MINLINNERHYNNYKINSNLKYSFNKPHLEKIIAVLNQSRHEMIKPVCGHITIYITSAFDIKTLIPKIKRAVPDIPLDFSYTIERHFRLHIHLMLILETEGVSNPDTLFVEKVIPAIEKLKHVMGCDFNLRKNKDTHYHDLTSPIDFRDSIQRYSYYAKTNQKDWVPKSFKKTFGTSQINKKYYAMDTNSMLTIKHIRPNKKFKFSDNKIINNNYVDFIIGRNTNTETKLCFHFEDVNTKQAVGYYGLTSDSEATETVVSLYLSLDAFYMITEYINHEWGDILYTHLTTQVTAIVANAKSKLGKNQNLDISAVTDNPELDDLLSLVINSVCLELDIPLANQ